MTGLRISIAMATYNGAGFLQAQLQSLVEQVQLPCELVACDDGSQDDTLAVLQEFKNGAPFPVTIVGNPTRLGYAANFRKAASLCTGDWVAFCDQDDWWLDGKLSAARDAIIATPGINLVLQNAILCDEVLTPTNRLFPAHLPAGLYGRRSQHGFWVWHGFLQTFRRDLLDRIADHPLPSNFPGAGLLSHDKWTCYVANALGGILVLDAPSALYRRHRAALTGSHRRPTLHERLTASLGIGSDHYRQGAEAAAAVAACFRAWESKCEQPADREALAASAGDFDDLAQIFDMRSKLHAADGVLDRLSRWRAMWTSGAYTGPRVTSIGLKSALKDAAVAVGALDVLRRMA